MKICIIGGGIAGIISAIVCLSYGFEIFIMEKQRDFGGCWINYANKDTRLEGYPSTYNYYYNLLAKKKTLYTDFPTMNAKDIIYIIRNLARQHNLYKYTKFNTEVSNVEDIKDIKKYKITTSDKIYYFDAILICPGLLQTPKKLKLHNFTKEIQYSYDLNPERLKNKNVLILGWGASALESLVTADKYNAKKITLMGRKTKWIWPRKYVLFLISVYNLCGRKFAVIFVTLFNCIFYIYHGCYKYIPKTPFHDFNYVPAINDDFFKLHYKKNINYLLDNIKNIKNNTVYTTNGKIFKPDIIISAIGFHKQNFSFIDKSIRPKELYKTIYPLKTDRMGIIGIPHGLHQPDVGIEQIKLFCNNLKYNTTPTYEQKIRMNPFNVSRIITHTEIINDLKN